MGATVFTLLTTSSFLGLQLLSKSMYFSHSRAVVDAEVELKGINRPGGGDAESAWYQLADGTINMGNNKMHDATHRH